jgi:secondary thiamine-phosphate synthase enzyme
MIVTRGLQIQTKGHTDIQNITPQIVQAVGKSGIAAGTVTIFCPGSTGGITTIEFEAGVVADLRQILDEIVPPNRDYQHHRRWGDDNGSSHVRAALVGPSLTVPIVDGRLALGTWQQVVFLDFDTSPRSRELILQIVGEA